MELAPAGSLTPVPPRSSAPAPALLAPPRATSSGFSNILSLADARQSPEARARDAAGQFVALTLVQPALRILRESSQAAPPFAPSEGEKQFRALLDAELARRIVRKSNFGLVDRLARDLLRVRP